MNALLASDPALPQRDRLLDEKLMAPLLSGLIDPARTSGVQHCRRLRTKYRVGASLRVLYEVNGNRIAARTYPTTRASDLNTTFWKFPDDRKIKNLSMLVQMPCELANINGRQWIASRVVGHAPEKSLTAQCLSADGSVLAYAKVYAGDEGHQVFNIHNHVSAALKNCELDLHVPRALSYSRTYRVLLLESVAGFSLAAIPYASQERSLFHLGIALRKLHAIKPPASIPQFARLAPENLKLAAETISNVRPDVAEIAHRLSARLLAHHETFSLGDEVLLHGDVHAKNVLLNRQGLFLLDLDQAGLGVAALDVGSVIGSLYHAACIDAITASKCSSLTDAFLFGYGLCDSPITTGALRWHVAATLFVERALRAVTRIRPASLKKLPQILTTAENVAEKLGEK